MSYVADNRAWFEAMIQDSRKMKLCDMAMELKMVVHEIIKNNLRHHLIRS